mmetsp:Transcript_41798/g.75885  ORF Transcript_41798/g.75885 Transcript_41798/m.75885 type:complete len:472 (+) Transcript_41798:61-1476(+)
MSGSVWQHPPPDLIDHVRSEIFRLLTANAQAVAAQCAELLIRQVWSASLSQVDYTQLAAPHDARPRGSLGGSSHDAVVNKVVVDSDPVSSGAVASTAPVHPVCSPSGQRLSGSRANSTKGSSSSLSSEAYISPAATPTLMPKAGASKLSLMTKISGLEAARGRALAETREAEPAYNAMPRPAPGEVPPDADVPALENAASSSTQVAGSRRSVENSDATFTWDVSGYNFSSFEPSSYIDSENFSLGPLESCQLRVWPRHGGETMCVKLFLKDETRLQCRLSVDSEHADACCTKEADGLSPHMVAFFPCRAGQLFSSIRAEVLQAPCPSEEASSTAPLAALPQPPASESELDLELKALKAVIDEIVTQIVNLLPKADQEAFYGASRLHGSGEASASQEPVVSTRTSTSPAKQPHSEPPRCTAADQAIPELWDELSALQELLDNAVRSATDLQENQRSQRQKQATEQVAGLPGG